MMTSETGWRILNHSRDISGSVHWMVERSDGYRFYLDEAFVFALKNAACSQVSADLVRLGADPDEVDDIFRMLAAAGLVEEKKTDGS